MYDTNTVFIVGAGASAEAKMPIGSQLTKQIAGLVDLYFERRHLVRGDANIHEALKRLADSDPRFTENKFVGSGRAVAEAMQLALSIDTFLESHASNEEFVALGKLGIVRAIQLAERESLLAPTNHGSDPFDMDGLSDTWYYSLARQLFTGIPVEDPLSAFENVSFIVFNYDRCLQVFLLRALQIYFRLSPQEAEEVLRRVRILHPYGWLGSVMHGDDHVPFAPSSMDLVKASERIKTFSESADSEVMSTAKQWMDAASTQIYLGFGFHKQNMQLLEPDQSYLDDGTSLFQFKAYATAHNLSPSDENVVKDKIAYLRTGGPYNTSRPWIQTVRGTCSMLFRNHWLSLTS